MEEQSKHIISGQPDCTQLLRYIRNLSTQEESNWIEAWWQSDKENEKKLLQLALLTYACLAHDRMKLRDPLSAYKRVRSKIIRKRRVSLLYKTCLAASLTGLIALSSYLLCEKETTADIFSHMVVVEANPGTRVRFVLPDGTVAYLNSGSKITYPDQYPTSERRIFLSGEAYFNVVTDKEKPFIVSVLDNHMRVKVTGTEFNLQAYESSDFVRTTLVKGAVRLELGKEEKDALTVNMSPSEKASYNRHTEKVSITKVDTEYETCWKEGRLMFKNMSVPELLEKLSYFYNVTFQVDDPVINTYAFTGIFDRKHLSQVLDYLKISSPIDYEIKYAETDDSQDIQHTVVILKNRKK